MLRISNLSYKEVFESINLEVRTLPGEIVTLMGKNGSGKSTFAKLIAKLDDYQGSITLNEKEEYKVGLVFQNPDSQFIRNIVIDDLAFSLESLNYSKDEMDKKILEVAKEFDIENLLQRDILKLSGGQKQKIAIVANLLLKPDVIILDEAFEMVDYKNTISILYTLKKYLKSTKTLCIHITHNISHLEYSTEVIYFKDKKIIFYDTKEKFLKQEELLKEENLDIPFYVKLSSVMNKTISSEEELKRILCSLN